MGWEATPGLPVPDTVSAAELLKSQVGVPTPPGPQKSPCVEVGSRGCQGGPAPTRRALLQKAVWRQAEEDTPGARQGGSRGRASPASPGVGTPTFPCPSRWLSAASLRGEGLHCLIRKTQRDLELIRRTFSGGPSPVA